MPHLKNKRVLVTGADGFVGKNLCLFLGTMGDVELIKFTRETDVASLPQLVANVDCVIHLAGVNRTTDPSHFELGNTKLTEELCEAISRAMPKHTIKFIMASSTQATLENSYGKSKRAAEEIVFANAFVDAYVFRLPNVFGKWCKPNYNSAVATFCHNIAHNLPITINDPKAPLTLAYVDDVTSAFFDVLSGKVPPPDRNAFAKVETTYKTTVGGIADQIKSFHQERRELKIKEVGVGLSRALYSTYVSYLDPENFSYALPQHGDDRGVFVEMLKTQDSGQFSFFTARPGITRGGHYHHTKTEKFLVIKGKARFRFQNVLDGQTRELLTNGAEARVVDTVPGWAHDITNVGEEDLVVMLWANELFDRDRPDTYAWKLS